MKWENEQWARGVFPTRPPLPNLPCAAIGFCPVFIPAPHQLTQIPTNGHANGAQCRQTTALAVLKVPVAQNSCYFAFVSLPRNFCFPFSLFCWFVWPRNKACSLHVNIGIHKTSLTTSIIVDVICKSSLVLFVLLLLHLDLLLVGLLLKRHQNVVIYPNLRERVQYGLDDLTQFEKDISVVFVSIIYCKSNEQIFRLQKCHNNQFLL